MGFATSSLSCLIKRRTLFSEMVTRCLASEAITAVARLASCRYRFASASANGT
jgi:hypothetical protein